MLEQLKKEQAEELEKVQRHLEAAEQGLRDLEDNLRVLQNASTTADSEMMTEVRAHQEDHTGRLNLNTDKRLIYLLDWFFNMIISHSSISSCRRRGEGSLHRQDP